MDNRVDNRISFNKGMICLRLLYRHIDHFVGDQDWVHQNFVALLRLVPSPCCPNSEALRFLTDLMTNLQELSIAPLSTAESDAALIVRHPSIFLSPLLCAKISIRYCENKSNLRIPNAAFWKLKHGVTSAGIKYFVMQAAQTSPSFSGRNSLFLDERIPNVNFRKMMDCSYRAGDYAEVKSTWEQLLLRQARDPTGLHMMYQISLRDAHVESGMNEKRENFHWSNGPN